MKGESVHPFCETAVCILTIALASPDIVSAGAIPTGYQQHIDLNDDYRALRVKNQENQCPFPYFISPRPFLNIHPCKG